ncbi:MAG TPA: VOC family protein [Solirubrobacterales bacterium]|jgi:glyoxalase family protein|nr:VOC family protein [Solirubrobacterales bacterium]
MNLFGLHHVSAIASSRRECEHFYGRLLGLEAAADAGDGTLAFSAGPERGGGVLSFVVSPGAAPGVAGRGLVHRLRWSVPAPAALDHWRRRLERAGVAVTAWLNGAGDPLALRFSDSDGLEHELTLPPAFVLSPPIPRKGRTPGDLGLVLTGVRAYAADSVQSGDLLAGRLGFEACGKGAWRVGAGTGAVRYETEAPPPSRPVEGAGSVRHVAWACRPGEERAWRQRVIGMGATVSRLIECDGYRCFFFREPDGVLFGVATLRSAPAQAHPRFELPQPSEIPPRIARPIGILAAA